MDSLDIKGGRDGQTDWLDLSCFEQLKENNQTILYPQSFTIYSIIRKNKFETNDVISQIFKMQFKDWQF